MQTSTFYDLIDASTCTPIFKPQCAIQITDLRQTYIRVVVRVLTILTDCPTIRILSLLEYPES